MGFFALVLMVLAIQFLRRAQADPSLLAGAGRTWQLLARILLGLAVAQSLFRLIQVSSLQALRPGNAVFSWGLALAVQGLDLLLAVVAGWALWQDLRFPRSATPPAGAARPAEPLTLDRAMVGLWRGVVMVTLVMAMAGFGLCGGMGVLGGLSSLFNGDSGGVALIGLGAVGLGIAWWLARRAFRAPSAKDPR